MIKLSLISYRKLGNRKNKIAFNLFGKIHGLEQIPMNIWQIISIYRRNKHQLLLDLFHVWAKIHQQMQQILCQQKVFFRALAVDL
jgi:hypothetical protein